FPNANPVGQHLSAIVRGKSETLEIIGVAKDTNSRGLRTTPYPTVYVSYAQLTGNFPSTVTIHVTGSISAAAAAIRNVVQARLPESAIDVHALSAQVDATIVQ